MNIIIRIVMLSVSFFATALAYGDEIVFKAGHSSLQEWLLPAQAPTPPNNETTTARVELGKKLFFDARLSGDGNMSCATCHNPMYGWSDGLKTARGFQSQILGRATPTVVNTGFNTIQMWDGRKATLEDQAMGPMETTVEMNTDIPKMLRYLRSEPSYRVEFASAYPDDDIGPGTVSRALAAFQRTLISNNSPFDQWVKGDEEAMSPEQVEGFKIFVDAERGNCAVCHSAPNFTDDGFHNLGLASFAAEEPDLGRYSERPLRLMKGAFKTPTLRDITLTAPYFHDGSAETLDEVVVHYVKGGEVKTNLSPNMKALSLTETEERQLIAFMTALTSEHETFELPRLPPKTYLAGGEE